MKSIKIISLVLGFMMGAQAFGFSTLPSPNDYQNDPEGYYRACTDNNNDEGSCEQATNQYYPENEEVVESSATSTDTVVSSDLVSQNEVETDPASY